MTFLSIGSALVATYPAPSYTPTLVGGTLGSGQEYAGYIPNSATGFPCVIMCHTAGGDETIATGQFSRAVAQRLASYGFYVAAGEDGGTETWGNDLSRADIDEVYAYLQGQGADEQVAFVGYSMGLVSALSWVSDGNLASTFAVTSIVGVASMENCHDGDPTGLGVSMDNAYGSHANWVAALPTRDPLTLATAGAFDGLKVRQWTGATDTTCPTEQAELLAAAIGSTADVIEGPGNHFETVVSYDQLAVADYIMGCYAPVAATRTLVTV